MAPALRRVALATLSLLLAAAPGLAASYTNPVKGGDYPDPSVIRTADGFWATATSSEWAPHFPLLHSHDLVNWEVKGSVFPRAPDWAIGSFWAPEITEYKGKYFIYYTARRKDRRLAVAVATADSPGGPYTDHGELVAQEMGSIDAMAFTDRDGTRWLMWKEDGNSQKKPTLIWLQKLSEDGLRLVGDRHELFRNDAPWEGAVVEGPFVLYRDGYYYLFYSGAGCCGRGCNYALGVARAKEILGPWEKCPRNPLIADNEAWRCPGHGSIVSAGESRYWLIYHAYSQDGFVTTGRQMMLDEVVFGDDGWPSINRGEGPSIMARAPALCREQRSTWERRVDFNGGDGIGPEWQWPLRRRPEVEVKNGVLSIAVSGKPVFLAQSVAESSFIAETALEVVEGAEAGIAAIGDHSNYIAFSVTPAGLSIKTVQRGKEQASAKVTDTLHGRIRLRIASSDGRQFRFAYAREDTDWSEVSENLDGSSLPPWDRGLRCGVIATGQPKTQVSFDYFELRRGSADLLSR